MKIRSVFITCISAAILISSCFINEVYASDTAGITVAGITGQNPIEFNDSKFGPSGIYVDLWKLWSEKTGIRVSYVIMQSEEADKALAVGKADVIMDYSPRPGSADKVSLVRDIYSADLYIYSDMAIPPAESQQDLLPYRVGIIKEDISRIGLPDNNITFLVMDSLSALFESAKNGEIKMFVARGAHVNHELVTGGKWKNFVQSSKPLYSYKIQAAVRSDKKDLLQKIESGFSKITETERIVIEKSWSGGNIKYRIPWGFLATIIIILALIGGVIVIWWWNYQLQSKVDEATEELKAMKEEAEAANLAKSRFLDNISHELRTPLTLIIAPVENAINGKPLGTEALEMIRRNSRNLLSLINDLLDLSRITAGKMKLKVSETDLCSVVKLYCAEMESVAEYNGISLSCSVPDEPLKVYIDRGKFSGIISNFFSNSLKYAGRGERIALSLVKERDEVILKFSDTGPGIPPDKVSTIFDRFSQADAVTSRSHEGTGIGLSIVKEIADLHGGSASVENRYIDDYQEDHGVDFIIRIPSGNDHFSGREDVEFADTAGAAIELPFVRGSFIKEPGKTGISQNIHTDDERASILIVEDNPDMSRFLEGLLGDYYDIYCASNGREALDKLENMEPFDLIISDVMMPVMDGNELLKRINSDEKFSGIPVLILTARNDDLVKHQGLELGAVDYVVKPFNPDELLLRVRNHMQLSVMRNTLQRRNVELYTELKQRLQPDTRKHEVTDDMKHKMDSVCSFIRENFRNDLSRDMIAATIGINPDQFSRVFNQYTGQTLPDFINGFRMGEAKELLLNTDKTVSRVAIETGFENLRTFNRVFKKFTGMSPSGFREGES